MYVSITIIIISSSSINCTEGSIQSQLECEQMPNVMVALPNTGGAFCSTPVSLADTHY